MSPLLNRIQAIPLIICKLNMMKEMFERRVNLTLRFKPVFRPSRHADGLFTSGYSKLLGQLSAKEYLESLLAKRVR